MKILCITPWFPSPPDNGTKIRLYNLVRVLGQRHSITLLSFVREGDRLTANGLNGFCETIHTVPWRSFNPTNSKALAGFLSRTPRSVADTYSPAMADLVRNAGEFDVILASTQDAALYALKGSARVRVLEEHNSMTAWMREQYRAQTNVLMRARYALTFFKHQRFERWLYAQFDACTMVSETDARATRELLDYRKPLAVVPNAMDLDYYRPGYQPQPNTLIYNGSLTYDANFDAMQFFVRDIWRRIRADVPAVTLQITGRVEGTADAIASEGISFTGYLEDIRPAVGQAWACVVPLRTGGGTRLKILEAMALGTPVIATTKGAEGLDVTHGENILLADAPVEFAAHTLALLRDADLRARLSRNARRLVEERYTWEASVKKMDEFLSARLAAKNAHV